MTPPDGFGARVRFRWSGGGAGRIKVRRTPDGTVRALPVSFD
jgi:hypothetical protein